MAKHFWTLPLFFFISCSFTLQAQQDSARVKPSLLQRLDSIKQWKLETGRSTLTPFLAPSYSPEMQLTLTAGGLFTFKLDPNNPVLSRSSMPFSIGYSTNGSLMVSVKANIYGRNDKLRMTGEYWLKYMPDNYWGVGFDNARNTPVSDSTTAYHRDWRQFKFKVVYEMVRNFFIGVNYDRNSTTASDIKQKMATDPDFLEYGPEIKNSGFGMVWRYDSRDFPENAFRGVLFELSGTAYGRHTSSYHIFRAAELDYRQYQQIVRAGSTLAWELKARTTSGDVPWTELSMVGTPFDLRGYSWGRFRDGSMAFLLAEYRYMLKRKTPKQDGRMYGPFGFVVWGGLGSVADKFADIKKGIPNAGIGIRFELQKRMNIRLDYGFGFESKAFYISFNEAF